MTPQFCRQEDAVISALRTGAFTDDLLAHIANCPNCSEAIMVAGALPDLLPPETELYPPDTALVWRRAEQAARQHTILRATLPIRMVRTTALAAAIFAGPWLTYELASNGWMPELPWRQLFADSTGFTFVTGSMLAGVTLTLACIVIGSWFALRAE